MNLHKSSVIITTIIIITVLLFIIIITKGRFLVAKINISFLNFAGNKNSRRK